MIRVIRKHNEVLQFCMMPDKHLLGQAVVFDNHSHVVDYLRPFLTDYDNAVILRKILQEAAPWQFNIPSLTDHQVVAHVARMVVQGLVVVGRGKQDKIAGGSAGIVAKELVEEGKKWDKSAYVAGFLADNAPKAAIEPAQKTNWVAFQVVYDDTDEPVSGVDLKIKLPDGTANIYTTDAAGKIYIAGLPEGMCDIKEMLDNDALEVVNIAAAG